MNNNQDANKIPLPSLNHQETNPNRHITNPPSKSYQEIVTAIKKFNEDLLLITESMGELSLSESRKISSDLHESRINIDFVNKYFDEFILRR